MSITNIQATKITQPLGGKRIQDSKGKNIKSPSVCRDGNADPSYHPWESGTLNNFLEGKQIQCGRKSTYACNLKTVRWIKGYRNTCPIAGCCGTFNRPAPLELTKFNFKQKQITKKINISKIQLSYMHHATGVDVGVGKGSEKKNWTGYFPYVDIILYRVSGNNKTKIQTVRHDKAVPLATNTTVVASFTKDIKNFNPSSEDLLIEINYPANGDGRYYTKATNPSIIYATGLKIKMDYAFIEQPKIESTISSSDGQKTIITDPRNPNDSSASASCRTTMSHTIKFNHTTANDIIVSVPDRVTYEKVVQGNTAVFTYQDKSGVQGEKTITYSLKSNKSQKIVKKYTAKMYTKPTIKLITQYIKNQKHTASNTYVDISGSCWNNIKIFVDGNKKLLKSFTKPNVSQEAFLNEINKLTCGYHTLKIYIDDIFYKDVNIRIQAPNIAFEANLEGIYKQNKSSNKIPITIKRIDSYNLKNKIAITVTDTATKDEPPATFTLDPYEECITYINIYRAGSFELKYKYDDGCSIREKTFGTYVVEPIHVASYDNLLIRAENTSMKYNSIVVRKGDKQTKPVTYRVATLHDSMNNIVLFGKDGVCALGDLGYGILAVKNVSQEPIKNLCVELNPLIESDDEEGYNPLVMEWQTGMLQNFVKNFDILNPNFKNIVEIFNIQNNDLVNEGTENVVLRITEINPSQVFELKIPFSYPYSKEIYMNFLLLGEPTDFVDLDNNTQAEYQTNDAFYNKVYDIDGSDIEFFASHTSKQAERGCMCISLKTIDLLSAELSISGDDLDKNDMTNTDDLDITYSIQLSESDCDENNNDDIRVSTKIVNDCHLIPTAYQIAGQEKQIIDSINDNQIYKQYFDEDAYITIHRGIDKSEKVVTNADIYLRYKDINNNIRYLRALTDNTGVARFKYVIPDYHQNNNDTALSINTKSKYYLQDILETVDIVYNGDDFYEEKSLSNTVNPLLGTTMNVLGYVYYDIDDADKTQPHFVNINNPRTVSNVSDVYVVGFLSDSDGQGVNDKIIEYNEKYSVSGETRYLSQKTITVTNNTRFYGQDKDGELGFFKIKINKPDTTSYNLSQVTNNSVVFFNGDLYYEKTNLSTAQKHNKIPTNKFSTKLSVLDDYGAYYRGDTIEIAVRLMAENIPTFYNYIEINHRLRACKQDIHIFYKMCTEKNTKGFKTIYRTNSDNLIPNQTDATIYCGVDTDLKILARLQKKIVENHSINVLTINAINGYKPNKEVLVKAFIGPNKDKQRLGDYLALSAVDIDKEKYSYDQSSDIVYWKIGDMESYETQICNILLEGEDVGHNTIYVCGFDYLMPDVEQIIPTSLTLVNMNEQDSYYIDKVIDVKATLQQDGTTHDLFGQVYFDINYLDEGEWNDNNWSTISQGQISNFNGEYYALGHIRLKKTVPAKIRARYEGSKMLSLEYTSSQSDELMINQIKKYDTIVQLRTNDEELRVNNNIQITGSVLFNPHEEDSQTIYDKYFDKNLNIKFFVENQEINNISYVNQEYVINFMVTQPGDYTIKAFIPDTEKTEGASDTIKITVIGEENG